MNGIPIEHVKNTSLDLTGKLRRYRRPFDPVERGDNLRFILSQGTEELVPFATAETGTGITFGDDGSFRIIMQAEIFDREAATYHWDMSITEGDSAHTYYVAGGPFVLVDSGI